MVHESTAQAANTASRSRFENGSPLTVIPSWAVSLALHVLLLFFLATELKSCGDPAGVGQGEVLREVGIYVKQATESESQRESSDDSPATSELSSESEIIVNADRPIVPDEPPVATVLPSERRDILGAGVPPAPASDGSLPQTLRPGERVRPAGTTPPAPGQVSFFGASDTGKRVVYVLDCSSSMDINDAIGVARSELKASLNQLRRDQQFQVIFYNNNRRIIQFRGAEEPQLLSATAINRNLAVQFIDAQVASGGTNHMPALRRALGFRPDVIFLLTDADEPRLQAADFAEIRRLNKGRCRIHCIEFGKHADLSGVGNFLKKLAHQGRGTYRYYDVTRFSRR